MESAIYILGEKHDENNKREDFNPGYALPPELVGQRKSNSSGQDLRTKYTTSMTGSAVVQAKYLGGGAGRDELCVYWKKRSVSKSKDWINLKCLSRNDKPEIMCKKGNQM